MLLNVARSYCVLEIDTQIQSVFVEDLVINVNHCNLTTEQKLDLPFGLARNKP